MFGEIASVSEICKNVSPPQNFITTTSRSFGLRFCTASAQNQRFLVLLQHRVQPDILEIIQVNDRLLAFPAARFAAVVIEPAETDRRENQRQIRRAAARVRPGGATSAGSPPAPDPRHRGGNCSSRGQTTAAAGRFRPAIASMRLREIPSSKGLMPHVRGFCLKNRSLPAEAPVSVEKPDFSRHGQPAERHRFVLFIGAGGIDRGVRGGVVGLRGSRFPPSIFRLPRR